MPADISEDVIARLIVEFDGFDVTSFAHRQGRQLTISLSFPVDPGTHEIMLSEITRDGQVTPHGRWSIKFEGGAGPEVASLTGSVLGTLSARLATEDVTPKPPSFAADGAAEIEGRIADGGWQVQHRASAFFNSRRDRNITPQHADLGNFWVSGSAEDEDLFFGAQFGQHDLGVNNLIMSGFNRRGASFRAKSKKGLFDLSLFAQKPEYTVGAEHWTGLDEQEHRVAGVNLNLRPFKIFGQSFLFSGNAYSGEGSDAGSNGNGGNNHDGKGFSLAVDNYWFDNRLNTRAEFAKTVTDYGAGDNKSYAFNAAGNFALFRNATIDNKPVVVNLGGQHQRVGTFFGSLANQYLAGDQRMSSVNANLMWAGVYASVQASQRKDNVDKSEVIPTNRIQELLADAVYSPDAADWPTWIGSPTFNLGGRLIEGRQIEAPPGYLGFDYDEGLGSSTVGVSSAYERWSWNLSHVFTTYWDDTNFKDDTDQHILDAGVSAYFGDRIYLSPSVQWVHTNNLDLAQQDNFVNLLLSGQLVLIPDTLNSTFSSGFNLHGGTIDRPSAFNASGEIDWSVLAPKPNRPGFSLALTGSYQANEQGFGLEEDAYQIFAQLKINSPISFGGR
jgi:hypothetical protein